MTDDPENRERRESPENRENPESEDAAEGAGQDEAQPARPVHPMARRPEDGLSAEGIRRMSGEHDLGALRRLVEPTDLVALGRSILEREERNLAQMRRWIEEEERKGRFDLPYWPEEGSEQ